jgi:phosphoribosyl-AMP cyclohydrolase
MTAGEVLPVDPAGQSPADPAAGLQFNDAGLICAVVQQYDSREVLMVAWMDAEALRRTIETGAATYFSRSRREYWVKGATSGNTQRVVQVRRDCDGDTLLVLVDQTGVACHTGARTCFDDGLIDHRGPAHEPIREAISTTR